MPDRACGTGATAVAAAMSVQLNRLQLQCRGKRSASP
jgi:diaminopimelate epimerase